MGYFTGSGASRKRSGYFTGSGSSRSSFGGFGIRPMDSGPTGQPPQGQDERAYNPVTRPDVNEFYQGALGTGMNVAQAAFHAPGYIGERPLAWANEANRMGGEKGAVDTGLDALRNIPFLGDVMSGAGDFLTTPWLAKFVNAGTADMLSKSYGMPDSSPVPDIIQQIMGGAANVPIIGSFVDGLGLEGSTLGDLRRNATERGFTRQDIEDVRAGRKSVWDFQDKQVHTGALENLALQIAADPLNLAFGAGLAAKVPLGVGMLRRGFEMGGKLGISSGKVPQAVKAWEAGRNLRSLPMDLTYTGFAGVMAKLGRGTSQASRAYMATALGTTGAELGVTALTDPTSDFSFKGPFFEDLFQFGRAVQENKPLSEGKLYPIVAAFKFPYTQTAGGARDLWKRGHYRLSGSNMVPLADDFFASHLPGRPTGVAANKQIHEMFGGELSYYQMIEQVTKSIAAERTGWIGTATKALEGSPSWMELNYFIHLGGKVTENKLKQMLRNNEIPGTALVERIKQFATRDLREISTVAGGPSPAFNLQQFAQSWREFRSVSTQLTMAGEKVGAVVAGIMKDQALPREALQIMRADLKSAAVGGTVTREHVRQLGIDNPRLFLEEPSKTIFSRALTPDAGDIPLKDLDKALATLEKKSRPLKEYTHEIRDWEARQAAPLSRLRGVDPNTGRINPSMAPPVGGATVRTMSFRGRRARSIGARAATYDDVTRLRGDATTRFVEESTGKVLEEAGFNPELIHQGVGFSAAGRELVPTMTVSLRGGTPLERVRAAAVASMEAGAKRGNQQADIALVVLDKRHATAVGQRVNAWEFRWKLGALKPGQRTALHRVLVRSKLNYDDVDTSGILRVFARQRDEVDRARGLADEIAQAFPEDPVLGAVRPRREQVYFEAILNDTGRAVKPGPNEVLLSDVRRALERDHGYLSASNGFAEYRGLAGLAGRPRGGVGGRAGSERARRGLQPGDPAVVQKRVESAWAKFEEKPTTDRADKFLQELYEAGDPSLIPAALDDLRLAVETRFAGRVPRDLDVALLRAANDFVATGGNRGEVVFNAAMDGFSDLILPRFDASMSRAPLDVKQALAGIERQLRQSGSPYTLKMPPIVGDVPHVFHSNAAGQTLLENMRPQAKWVERLISSGTLSTAANFQRQLLRPRHWTEASNAAKQDTYNALLNKGANVEQANDYVTRLKEAAALFELPQGVRPFRSYDAMPLGVYETIARGEAGVFNVGLRKVDISSAKNAVFPPEVISAVASEGGFGLLIGKTTSAWWRGISDAARQGGPRGEMGRRLQQMYPKFFASRHMVGKLFYHLYRFLADIRWWAMNKVEIDQMTMWKYGSTGRSSAQASNFAQLESQGGGAFALDAMASGWWDPRRHVESRLMRIFDEEAPRSFQRIIDDMPRSNPHVRQLTEMFPDLPKERWAQQLFKKFDDFDNLGVDDTIIGQAKRQLAKDDFVALQESGMMQRIIEVNQATWDDLMRTVRGNPSRSVMERIANSYWVYWPISYQLKAGKWLYDVLTKKMFGRQTELGGTAMLNNLLETHESLLRDDPEYQAIWMDQNGPWFIASMLFPITPFDLGIGLGRPVRQIGAVTGVFPDERMPRNPLDFIIYSAKVGPAYTIELLERAQSQVFPAKPKSQEYPALPLY